MVWLAVIFDLPEVLAESLVRYSEVDAHLAVCHYRRSSTSHVI